MNYLYPDDRKAHVRRVVFSLTREVSWEAGRPGGVYMFGEGFHFDSWQDAIDYATNSRRETS